MPAAPDAALKATSSLSKAMVSQIHLRSRTYVPDDTSLSWMTEAMDAVRTNELERLHVLVQFEQVPSVAALKNRGVRVLNLVPQNTLVVSIPTAMAARDIPGVRWAGLLRWEDKIDDSASAVFCRSPKFASTEHVHASTEKPYVVNAFTDVSVEDLELIIHSAGGFVDPNPDLPAHQRMVWAFPDVMRSIAKDTRIAWITAAGDNLVRKERVTYCPGILTAFGPVAEFATIMGKNVMEGAGSSVETQKVERTEVTAEIRRTQVDGSFGSSGWDGPGLNSTSLKYYVGITPSGITGEATEIADALSTWSNYVQVTFNTTTANQNRSLDFNWYANQSSSHPQSLPDTAYGTTFAHAFPPPDATEFTIGATQYDIPETLAGDVHFNLDKQWKKGDQPDIFTEALHEIGHSLGLEHSSSTADVMGGIHPSLVDDLKANDIVRIRGLYKSTAPTSPPAIPGSLFVNSCGCYGGAHTNWGGSTGASKYQLYRSSGTSTSKSLLYDGTRIGMHIEIPAPGPQILWVRACNSAGCSGFKQGNKLATYTQGCF